MKNVFSGILFYVRGYRKLKVVAVVCGQVVVSDYKGRIGFLTGEVTPEEMEQGVVWAKPDGTKQVKQVTQASYHSYDTARLVHHMENIRYIAELRVHAEMALIDANRQYNIGECLAVNLDKVISVPNYIK